ncbi:hypothetical protein [Circoviridae 11 LDMD-2013]|uniref:hypothetical protein n=1 Tax=Circoviridae 11 LDMD-2013 TaxID=1379715 RepID=UPI0003845144|nr:hypothetical protein [Circoviridae 11 LDMD-2013]AGS36213.1 hypothetical protein [Circoviridae 11 LDMD-2013]
MRVDIPEMGYNLVSRDVDLIILLYARIWRRNMPALANTRIDVAGTINALYHSTNISRGPDSRRNGPLNSVLSTLNSKIPAFFLIRTSTFHLAADHFLHFEGQTATTATATPSPFASILFTISH